MGNFAFDISYLAFPFRYRKEIKLDKSFINKEEVKEIIIELLEVKKYTGDITEDRIFFENNSNFLLTNFTSRQILIEEREKEIIVVLWSWNYLMTVFMIVLSCLPLFAGESFATLLIMITLFLILSIFFFPSSLLLGYTIGRKLDRYKLL